MALSRISLNPPPNIDPTKGTLAYGRLALKRLRIELNDDSLLVRQRAVKALSDYIHDSENVASAINEVHGIGRQAFLDHDILSAYDKLYASTEPDIVRKRVHQSLALLTSVPLYAEGVVNKGLIPLLVGLSERELDELKPLVLETLSYILSFEPKSGLNANGMKIFTALLSHKDPSVRTKAALCILKMR
ncbi:unnamed protein product [Protopolystoma xenopodis]|uniref:Condensin complex subunit 1 C-terminal domain-containing protein n=1 Tax=Protopolystoma xenopodis TaxID=117903 RepID=A0A448WHW1_9PLAT|nr:unnamed protein product [Protopolystoma xenopodis]